MEPLTWWSPLSADKSGVHFALTGEEEIQPHEGRYGNGRAEHGGDGVCHLAGDGFGLGGCWFRRGGSRLARWPIRDSYSVLLAVVSAMGKNKDEEMED